MNKTGILIPALGIALSIFFALPIFAGDLNKPSEVMTLSSISEKFEAVYFTHERHVTMAGKCDTCHHEHGNNSALPCKSCHGVDVSVFKKSVTGNFGACSNCHGKADPNAPQIPSLKAAYHTQCFQCHRGMGNVGTDPKGCAELCHAKKQQVASAKR